MEWKARLWRFVERVKPIVEKALQFLRKTFSDKGNIIRFAFASVAVIVTSQLMPGITIASFWVALVLVLVLISLITAAKPALDYFKLPFTLIYYGLFLAISYSLLLIFLDWILWYFETLSIWWLLLFCLIQAVFNCLIENLIQEE